MYMREAWTDERLDDLSERMDRGFDRVDEDLREIRADVNSLRSEMNARFDAVIKAIVGICPTLVTGFVAMATLIVALG